MWETIRGFLTFTKKERVGVLFLLLLITVLCVLPFFFQPVPGSPDPSATSLFNDSIRQFRIQDSVNHQHFQSRSAPPDYSDKPVAASLAHYPLFYFDPNKINASDWQRLGISEKLSGTILRYVAKGGFFRQPADLKKLYGLRNEDYERLLPYVRFENEIRVPKSTKQFLNKPPLRVSSVLLYPKKTFTLTDINKSDSAGWAMLPGIGEKLAGRIVHFRDKLGGFYEINQVSETFGLPDSTFQRIKPYLQLQHITLTQIDLNTCSIETLQSHPYIKWNSAKMIIRFRNQHGRFHSVDDLLQIIELDRNQFTKFKPYITVSL